MFRQLACMLTEDFSVNKPFIRRKAENLRIFAPQNYFDKLNNPTNDEEFC